MLDGILFEKHGVPSVSIITEVFEETGRAMADAWDAPNYGFVSIPHPIGNLSEEELDQRARQVVPKVVKILLPE